jgi:hypothetical protein
MIMTKLLKTILFGALLASSLTASAGDLVCAMYIVGANSLSLRDSPNVLFGGHVVTVHPGQKLFAQGGGMVLPHAAQGLPPIPLVLVDLNANGEIVLTDEVHGRSVAAADVATIVDDDQHLAVRCLTPKPKP